ncbi:MAG: GspH/FimT family protein [Acidobacteriota bacterium]|nr:GspH/FimT family protein [Acidobacteriota bacterium]
MKHSLRGYSLPELLAVMVVVGVMIMVAVPAVVSMRERAAIGAAAGEIRALFALARSQAIARGRNVGIKFLRVGDEWQYAFYEDGNENGVRNAEIVNGTDPLLKPYQTILRGVNAGRIGLPAVAVPNPTGSGVIKPNGSPIRFNQSTICSFTPLGSATSGSVFLTGGTDTVAALIVFGPTARIRLVRLQGGRWMK